MTGSINNAVGGTIYATQGFAGSGDLLVIDPVTGAASSIGNTGVPGMPGIAINDMGEMYGLGGNNAPGSRDLYRVDAATGAVFLVGTTGIQFMSDVEFGPGGDLYAVAVTGGGISNFYTLDLSTAAPTFVTSVNAELGGISFDPTDGTLYGSEYNGSVNINNLHVIDLGAGTATLVGSMGVGTGIGDILFDGSGNLFGVSGGGRDPNDFLSIDKNTALATVIGPTGWPAVTGLATFGVPEIAVTPSPLTASLITGGTSTQFLDVENAALPGNPSLPWSITEDNVPGGGDAPWLTVIPSSVTTSAG